MTDRIELNAQDLLAGGTRARTFTEALNTNIESIFSGSVAFDGDITAISELTTTGILRRTGDDTWTLGSTVNVAEGGTGAVSLASNGVLYGNGTGAIQALAQASSNTVLTGTGAAPAFSATPVVDKITGSAAGATFAAGSGSVYPGTVANTRFLAMLGTQASPDTSLDSVAVFQKWIDNATSGDAPSAVHVSLHASGSTLKPVGLIAEGIDHTSTVGAFVEGARFHGVSSNNVGSAFGGISASLHFGTDYVYAIGHEAEVQTHTGVDAPNETTGVKMSMSFNASNNGDDIADMAYNVNAFSGNTFRVGYHVYAGSVDQAGFRFINGTSVYGLDLRGGTFTYSIAAPNFTVTGAPGAAQVALAAASGYESYRVTSGSYFVDVFANDGATSSGLLVNGSQSISLLTASGSAVLDPSGNLDVSGAYLLSGSPLAATHLTDVRETAAALESAHIPASVDVVTIQGYYAAGDGGGALYKRAALEPSHPGKLQSADGAWWELAELRAHPKMFGAKGDGATDDTTSIDNWLTFIAGDVGTVASGVYISTGGHEVATGTKIYAENATIKLKNNTASLPNSMVSSASGGRPSDIEIHGLTVDGNRENNINHGTPDANGNQEQGWEGLPVALVSFADCDRVKLIGCTIKNGWGGGVWFVDCRDFEASGNVVLDCRKSGIAVRRRVPIVDLGTINYRIVNNNVEGCTVGIHSIFGNKCGVIADNTCVNNKDSNGYPAFAWNGTYPNVYPDAPGFVTDADPNYSSPVNEGDGAGIELTGYYTVANAAKEESISINSNVCTGNIYGIRAEQDAHDLTISGNSCSDSDESGILLYSAQNVIVDSNTLQLNKSGIEIKKATSQDRPSEIILSGNNIKRNESWAVICGGVFGLLVKGNFSSGNNTDAGQTGGFLTAFTQDSQICDYIDILDNAVSESGDYWILDDGTSADVRIEGNRFTGAPGAKLSGLSASAVIRGNEGYATRNSGTSSVAQNSFVTINHGLAITPSVAKINITPVEDLVGGNLYVGPTPSSTSFDVIMPGGPATLAFGWGIVD